MKFNYRSATVIAFFVLVGLLGVILINVQTPHPLNTSKVLGDRNYVNVTAYIRPETLTFKVYPEKRVPVTGNWSTIVNLTVVSCDDPSRIFTYNNIPTDDSGEGTLVIPAGDALIDSSYRFFIKGYSHLRREFNCYTLDHVDQYIDFTLEGKELLAGEISIIYDNHINSLDMSYLITHFGTSDNKADLNHDGIVDSLDFDILINNLFLTGD
jgi:hypothetical protein